MKAIVMAGGEGTRLRPLTCGCPKPMVRLFDKPVLERTVALLREHGIRDICFTLGYLPGVIEDWFGDGTGFGVRIETRVEKTPLGTAGGVRACADFIGGDDVLVISGDAVCDFDLTRLAAVYRAKACDALIVLYEHPEPLEYGLVVTDAEGRVERFVEKPDWGSVVTNRINTGIYFLSAGTVASIPAAGAPDFGKDIFPAMLREGRRLYAAAAEGYWCDVGSPEAYRRCCADVLAGDTGVPLEAPRLKKGVWAASPVPAGCRLIPPVYIGRRCTVAPGATIGPDTALGDGTSVAAGASVARSVTEGASVGARAKVNGAILCRGAQVGEDAEVESGAVVGERCVLGEGCLVASGVKLWPGHTVRGGTRAVEDRTASVPDEKPAFGSARALCGAVSGALDPAAAAAVGAALGRLGSVGVSHTGGAAAEVLAAAALCGARGAGAETFWTDCAFEAEASFAAAQYGFASSLFVRQKGDEAVMTVFGRDGRRASRGLERKIEAALGGGILWASAGAFGPVSRVTGVRRAYLAAAGGERLPAGFRVAAPGTGAENEALRAALAAAGAAVTEKKRGMASFTAGEGGETLFAADEEGRSLSPERMTVLAADAAFRQGVKRLLIPAEAPAALEALAESCGAAVIRAGAVSETEEAAAPQRLAGDAVSVALAVCRAMATRQTTLSALEKELPPFAVAGRKVEIACGRARCMRLLAENRAGMAAEIAPGLTLDMPKGVVRVRPSGEGRTVEIYAEGADAETAEELCADMERYLKTLE